jgi:hypothetical protein
MEKVTHEIEFFKEHVVILKFVSESSAQGIRGRWLSDLEHAIRPGIIQHQREAGFGFVYIKLDKSKSMRRALVLSLFQCSAGTATLHRWVPAFNPLRPALFIPAWITLNYLPLEYVDEADKVAVAIGRILEVDLAAQEQSILWYCIELYAGDPWDARLNLASLGLEPGEVLIDYEGDEIRCFYCL